MSDMVGGMGETGIDMKPRDTMGGTKYEWYFSADKETQKRMSKTE